MKSNFMMEKHFSLSTHLLKEALRLKLSLEEFILLIYFEDAIDKSFNVELIKTATQLTELDILNTFNSLMGKHLIILKSTKDLEGRQKEVISLEPFYENILEEKIEEQKEEEKIDIYRSFETEFGRPISSMEYEIIGAWTEKGFKEELILGALKEAVYNGVTSLRYIDKILYEWQKKGYKTMKEVKSGLMKREEVKETNLFDYNWLDDNEE
ncbi:MAG: DnaD domain protein [Bacilli bacterium]|jgi:DNA replication protein|nr:DnaD domain protein [Bacilli bacterium]